MRLSRALLLTSSLVVLALPALAGKLDDESEQFLEQVQPLMTAAERKTFESLDGKGDREEFRKIFWKRRDPDLATEQNEFQAEYAKAKADVDTRFKRGDRPGSDSDCGRIYILLGAPDGVEKGTGAEGPMEQWTFSKDRPFVQFKEPLKLPFNNDCMLPSRARDFLERATTARIAYPEIDYVVDDGHIKKTLDDYLKAMLKPAAPAGVAGKLLAAPRTDFALAGETKLIVRSDKPEMPYVAGLVRGDAAALAVKPGKVLLAVEAVERMRETLALDSVVIRFIASVAASRVDGSRSSRARAVSSGMAGCADGPIRPSRKAARCRTSVRGSPSAWRSVGTAGAAEGP